MTDVLELYGIRQYDALPGFFATIEECLCLPVDYLAGKTVVCPRCLPYCENHMMVEGEGFYCPTCERTWDDSELREEIDRKIDERPANMFTDIF